MMNRGQQGCNIAAKSRSHCRIKELWDQLFAAIYAGQGEEFLKL
jgi:hypothetical protein